jgi:hypothetical protein
MKTPHTRPPRVSVPVTPEVHQAFKALGAVSGVSTGKAMADWLLDTLDAAKYLSEVLVKARASPGIAARELHAYAMGLTDETGTLLEQIRRGSRAAGVVDAQQPVAGRSGPLTPPSSNTGGKVPKNTNQPKRGTP